MLGIDNTGLVSRCCNKGTSGQVVCFSKKSAGSLMDGGHCCCIKKHLVNPCNTQMMLQICFHAFKVNTFKMAFGYYSGSQRLRRSIGQFVDEAVLSCQDDRHPWFSNWQMVCSSAKTSRRIKEASSTIRMIFIFFSRIRFIISFLIILTIMTLELLERWISRASTNCR
jgi:hypothetical protein